jgi:hypothetical protein
MAIYHVTCHACGTSGLCCEKDKCKDCDSSNVSSSEIVDDHSSDSTSMVSSMQETGSNFDSSSQNSYTDSYNGASNY